MWDRQPGPRHRSWGRHSTSSGWAGPQGGLDPEAATSYRAPPVPVNGLGNLGCGNNGVCCPVGQKLFSDPLTLPASGFSSSD